MKWTDLLGKFIYRVDKIAPQIVDGVIVNNNADCKDSVLHNVIPIEQHDPQSEPHIEPHNYPIMIPEYQPTFLIDDNSKGDLGLFMHWLESNHYKSFKSYISDIGIWRDRLKGHIDSTEILRVISEFNLTRAKRLIHSLKVYSHYRIDYGDPRITIIMALNERSLKLPTPKRTKSEDGLSPGTIEMLNDKAKALCIEGDRCGIWIGLLLRGIPSSSVERIEIVSDRVIKFKQWTATKEQRIPQWLFLAMTQRISELIWRRNRVIVGRRVCKYELPKVLYKNAAVSMAVLGE